MTRDKAKRKIALFTLVSFLWSQVAVQSVLAEQLTSGEKAGQSSEKIDAAQSIEGLEKTANQQANNVENLRIRFSQTSAEQAPTDEKLISADVNRDGLINIEDLVIVAHAEGQKGKGIAEDLNGDGEVGEADRQLVAALFGASTREAWANDITYQITQQIVDIAISAMLGDPSLSKEALTKRKQEAENLINEMLLEFDQKGRLDKIEQVFNQTVAERAKKTQEVINQVGLKIQGLGSSRTFEELKQNRDALVNQVNQSLFLEPEQQKALIQQINQRYTEVGAKLPYPNSVEQKIATQIQGIYALQPISEIQAIEKEISENPDIFYRDELRQEFQGTLQKVYHGAFGTLQIVDLNLMSSLSDPTASNERLEAQMRELTEWVNAYLFEADRPERLKKIQTKYEKVITERMAQRNQAESQINARIPKELNVSLTLDVLTKNREALTREVNASPFLEKTDRERLIQKINETFELVRAQLPGPASFRLVGPQEQKLEMGQLFKIQLEKPQEDADYSVVVELDGQKLTDPQDFTLGDGAIVIKAPDKAGTYAYHVVVTARKNEKELKVELNVKVTVLRPKPNPVRLEKPADFKGVFDVDQELEISFKAEAGVKYTAKLTGPDGKSLDASIAIEGEAGKVLLRGLGVGTYQLTVTGERDGRSVTGDPLPIEVTQTIGPAPASPILKIAGGLKSALETNELVVIQLTKEEGASYRAEVTLDGNPVNEGVRLDANAGTITLLSVQVGRYQIKVFAEKNGKTTLTDMTFEVSSITDPQARLLKDNGLLIYVGTVMDVEGAVWREDPTGKGQAVHDAVALLYASYNRLNGFKNSATPTPQKEVESFVETNNRYIQALREFGRNDLADRVKNALVTFLRQSGFGQLEELVELNNFNERPLPTLPVLKPPAGFNNILDIGQPLAVSFNPQEGVRYRAVVGVNGQEVPTNSVKVDDKAGTIAISPSQAGVYTIQLIAERSGKIIKSEPLSVTLTRILPPAPAKPVLTSLTGTDGFLRTGQSLEAKVTTLEPGVEYQGQVKKDGVEIKEGFSFDKTTGRITVEEPSVGLYEFQVTVTRDGKDVTSDPMKVMIVRVIPGPIQLLDLPALVTGNKVKISWTADPNARSGYQLIYAKQGSPRVVQTLPPGVISAEITDLEDDASYDISVVGLYLNIDGTIQQGASGTLKTIRVNIPAPIPGAISGINAVQKFPYEENIVMSWTPEVSSVEYEVFVDNAAEPIVVKSNTTLPISLKAGETHQVKIRGINKDGVKGTLTEFSNITVKPAIQRERLEALHEYSGIVSDVFNEYVRRFVEGNGGAFKVEVWQQFPSYQSFLRQTELYNQINGNWWNVTHNDIDLLEQRNEEYAKALEIEGQTNLAKRVREAMKAFKKAIGL